MNDTVITVYTVTDTVITVYTVTDTVITVYTVTDTVITVYTVTDTVITVYTVTDTVITVYTVTDTVITVYTVTDTVITVYTVRNAVLPHRMVRNRSTLLPVHMVKNEYSPTKTEYLLDYLLRSTDLPVDKLIQEHNISRHILLLQRSRSCGDQDVGTTLLPQCPDVSTVVDS